MRVAIACAAALAAWACVEKEGPKVDPAYVKANVLSAAPERLDSAVNADLGGKVVYLGNEIESEVLVPGGPVKVVHYWKIVDPPGSSWRVFSHLVGTGGEWMNVDATDMRTGYPPGKWKAGDVIRDEQSFTLKKDWRSKRATLTVGLYQKGASGADGRMPIVSGPQDAEGRVVAATFRVDGAAGSKAKTREYIVRRASGPIEIDGRADEAAWKEAPRSANFVTAEGGAEMPHQTHARLLWDDEHLYAFVELSDDDVFSSYEKHDEPLWKEDVIELFIDADGNRRGYVELQVNPNNAHFDAWFATTRAQKSDVAWNANMKSAVVVDGTADDRGDTDRGWTVEIAIPLESVKGQDAAMKVAIPPAVGDRWRLNMVRGDKPEGGSLRASSWNPIPVSDFHALGRMLTVVFADEEGGTKAASETAVTPAPEEEEAKPAPQEATK